MSEPSKVALLSLTTLDGAVVNAQQVNAREVISRLDPGRFEVTAFASGPIDRRLAGRAGLKVVQLRAHGKALHAVAEMLRDRDVIWYPHHGPAEMAYFLVLRPLLGRSRRPVTVMPLEGDLRILDDLAPGLRWRLSVLIRSVDVVVPITRHVASTLRERLGRKGPVIPVGVDTRAFSPAAERRSGPLSVVTVGSLIPRKRPELVLEAARELPNHRFVFIGDGPLRAALAREAPENVSFTGTVGRDDLPTALQGASVLLHPSRSEGMPKAVLEGMACGLPPVLFDTYRPDFVVHGESGFVVRTESEMTDALGRLLGDENLRRSMGAAARRTAEQYDWDVVARMWERLFHEVAARRQAGAAMDLDSLAEGVGAHSV